MGIRMAALAAGGIAVCGTQSAAVENWTIYDLGGSRKESICVAAATAAFQEFGNIFGLNRLAAGNWVVFAWGLSRGDHDAVITCSNAGGAGSRGTLVVYSEDAISARSMAQHIVESFDQKNQALQKDYIDKALEAHGL